MTTQHCVAGCRSLACKWNKGFQGRGEGIREIHLGGTEPLGTRHHCKMDYKTHQCHCKCFVATITQARSLTKAPVPVPVSHVPRTWGISKVRVAKVDREKKLASQCPKRFTPGIALVWNLATNCDALTRCVLTEAGIHTYIGSAACCVAGMSVKMVKMMLALAHCKSFPSVGPAPCNVEYVKEAVGLKGSFYKYVLSTINQLILAHS